MHSINTFNSKDLPYQRKRYTIAELLMMRYTLPYVCCPIKSFKPEAWSERILINIPANSFLDLDEKHRAKILASRLDLHRRNELTSRLQRQDSHTTRKHHPSRGTPPKPRVMPTIPEIPSLPSTPNSALTTGGSPAQPVSPDNGLFGGYGKAIETVASSNGLVASMHAFVPGGTLKTAPVTGVDAGDDSKWSMKGTPAIRRTSNTLSLADGLSSKDTPVVLSPADMVTTARKGVSVGSRTENTRVGAATNYTANATVKMEPPLVKPKALMAKRSSSNDQLAWIQFMMKKPIVSASQKAPQTKEALGAIVDEDIEVFKVFGEFDQLKATAGRAW